MLLEVDDLYVRYGSVTAVRGVSLNVDRGEIVGLIGSNGAGKSSVLNTVAGLVRAAAGHVAFGGNDITNERPDLIAQRGVCLAPEGRRIFGTLTVQENLMLAGHRARGDDRAAAMEEVLRRFPGLTRHVYSPAARLSGGEQQQLAIGRALMTKPDVLLLDEPSLGLAPKVTDAIFETLEQLRSDGLALLLVEQNAVRTVEVANRTYVLQNGVMADNGAAERLLDSRDLRDLHHRLGAQ